MSGSENRFNQSVANNIITAYHESLNNPASSSLSKVDLTHPINSKGETILHIICRTHNSNLLNKLARTNATFSEAINQRENVNGDTPIHCAVKVIKEGKGDKSFIDEMINLGADPNIENRQGSIVTSTSLKNDNSFVSKDSLHNSNKLSEQTILQNLGSLLTGSSVSNPHYDFIRKLTDHYIHQKGGVRRKLEDSFNMSDVDYEYQYEYDEFDEYDPGNEDGYRYEDMDYRTYVERPKFDPTAIDAYNKIVEDIMRIMDVDEETARAYRSALKWKVGQDNPELKKKENDLLKIQEIERLLKNESSAKKIMLTIDIEAVKNNIKEQKSKHKNNKNGKKDNKDNKDNRDKNDTDDKKTRTRTSKENTDTEEDEKVVKSSRKKAATTTSSRSASSSKLINGKRRTVRPDGYIETDDLDDFSSD